MWQLRCLAVITGVLMCVCLSFAKTKVDCVGYELCADSMFNKPTVVESRFVNSMVYNLTLTQRYSYYQCKEKDGTEKYGVMEDNKGWWVFKGCGGVFTVTECSENPNEMLIQKPREQIKSHHREIDRKCRMTLNLDKKQKEMKGF